MEWTPARIRLLDNVSDAQRDRFLAADHGIATPVPPSVAREPLGWHTSQVSAARSSSAIAPDPPARALLYLVVCAAPPARHIDELVELLHQAGWHICVIPTPRAASWVDCQILAQQTGYPIRPDHRLPGDPDSLPRADVIAVVPATFNTINKWAAGISDTFALGILNEAIGLKLPIIIAPYAKPSLAAHPEFDRNLKKLTEWGVNVLPNEVIRVRAEAQDTETTGGAKPAPHFSWQPVVEAVARSL